MAQTYEKVWQNLKKKGRAVLRINNQLLENEDKVLRRVKKAITKKKYNDLAFRKRNPCTRISYSIETKDSNRYLVLTLKDYIGEDYESFPREENSKTSD